MATDKQIMANRTNGQLGGVKTEMGKAKSKINSLKHGLSSSLPVLNAKFYKDDVLEFKKYKQSIFEKENPQDEFENAQVGFIVDGLWRKHCFSLIEQGLLNEIYLSATIPELGISLRENLERQRIKNNEITVLDDDLNIVAQLKVQKIPVEIFNELTKFQDIIRFKAIDLTKEKYFPIGESNVTIWKYARQELSMSDEEIFNYCDEKLQHYREYAEEQKRKLERDYKKGVEILDEIHSMEYYRVALERNSTYIQASHRIERVMSSVAMAYNRLYSYRNMKNGSLTGPHIKQLESHQ